MAAKHAPPPRLRLPPRDIAKRSLPLATLHRAWFRIHRSGRDPIHYGRSGLHRFDAPAAEFGVLYVAAELDGAFVEVHVRNGGRRDRLVALSTLAARTLSRVRFDRPVRLVDLTGPGLARVGADGRLTSSGSYRIAQRWSLAFHGHPDRPDGMLYRCRNDPDQLAAAVFERADLKADGASLGLLSDPRHALTLARVLDRYQVGLA